MDDLADQRFYSRHAKNYLGWEGPQGRHDDRAQGQQGKMPSMIHTRERWEKEDAYRNKVFSIKGRKVGPPIGLSHPQTGRDTPAFSFSMAPRFDD